MMSRQTDVIAFLQDLDGGVFIEKLGSVLSEVGGAVIDHEKVGKVSIDFDLSRIGSSYQVQIKHKLFYKRPTSRGDVSENNTTITPMFVGEAGKLSLFMDKQDQMFGKKGEVIDTETGEIKNG